MITITLAQLKSDIGSMMKGTSIRQVKNFYDTAANAAARMLARIDTEETRRTAVMTQPFYDNINDYSIATDFKRVIDIRPTAGRNSFIDNSNFSLTTAKQFDINKDWDTASIRWNNMVRTIRIQKLPSMAGVVMMDAFDNATSNGSWSASGDASGLYQEQLNYLQGNGALGLNLSGSTGSGYIVNSTASVIDLSTYLYEDSSNLFVYIPSGFSSRFTSFSLVRGDSATTYRTVTVTTKADGTSFSDGWNQLRFDWSTGTATGTMTNTLNTYRKFTFTYTTGAAINGVLLDHWTNSLGTLYEMEYYSEYLFRTATGTWIQKPTLDTDLINISPASYEIFKAEMMVDITEQIRTGSTQAQEAGEWRRKLDGTPQSRYARDPADKGLYFNYIRQFPSSAMVTQTITYEFDV